MKYKIKIVTFKTGRKLYYAYFKSRWSWRSITYDGNLCMGDYDYPERDRALNAIDKHFRGNSIIQTIEFEYITK